jgi:hypothetical protein
MILDCILDQCPKNPKDFVNHLVCPGCEYNPLGDNQPRCGCQECNHPKAIHKPNKKNMDIIRSTASVGHFLWVKH